MRIKQFTNDNGKPVMNRFTIYDEKTETKYFQSYASTIVKIKDGKVTLGKNWKYSITTSKYRSMYLRESTKETQAKLDSGEYLYDDTLI